MRSSNRKSSPACRQQARQRRQQAPLAVNSETIVLKVRAAGRSALVVNDGLFCRRSSRRPHSSKNSQRSASHQG